MSLSRVSKNYGSASVLRDLNLDIYPGTIHSIVGENGAGKSTVGKIISGVTRPSSGRILVQGGAVQFGNPADAASRGIARLHQELAMLPTRSVLENVLLGTLPSRFGIISRRKAYDEFDQLLSSTGFTLSPDALVERLSVADQQKVELLRALYRSPKIIVMDEPTAPLAEPDARRLHQIMKSLAAKGTAVVLISHFLEEVLELSDVVTIMRDGRHISTSAASDNTVDTLVAGMLGSAVDLEVDVPHLSNDAPTVLSVEGLQRSQGQPALNLNVKAGEIVGVAGLVGSGRSSLLRTIAGARKSFAGTISVGSKHVNIASPRQAINAGIAFIPESRKDEGLDLLRSKAANVALPYLKRLSRIGVLTRGYDRRFSGQILRTLDVRGGDSDTPVGLLSGGNQQKVLFAKWMIGRPKVLLADEPTRGVDIGSRRPIYSAITDAAKAGTAVVVVSSQLDELFALTHRIYVMRSGNIVAEFETAKTDKHSVLSASFE